MKRWKVTKNGIYHKCSDEFRIYYAADPEDWYENGIMSFGPQCYCGRYMKPPAKIERIIKLYQFEYLMKGYKYGTSE